ncbi:MAG: shikimate kinase [Bacillota bacterium]|jgi:shikimate kinase
MANIYLIGMPGSGKSTLGQIAAKSLGLAYVDLDHAIEKREKTTITEIFAQRGEAGFRQIESEELKKTAHKDGLLVSTGGGIVLRPENIDIMKKSGLVVFINRPLDLITKTINSNNRPLLQDNPQEKLQELYKNRYDLYKRASHLMLTNDGDIKEGAKRLIAVLISRGV